MSDVYSGLQPEQLWRHFGALNCIPRPSGEEAAARAYVQQIADEAGAPYNVDTAGNIIVRVPARNTTVSTPTVAIQAHLDMVCEKSPDVVHDFSRDPIRARRVGDLLYASGTTLGADNGIGAAAALALITTPDLTHGPLELIFTVEEETGLYGAMALDPTLVHAEMLLNLDSEDPKEITIGCAGGAGSSLFLPLHREAAPDGWLEYSVVVSGLKGGHSGVQIHEPLANAIKLLAGVLRQAQNAGLPFRLASITGGSAHNAIPRDASAVLLVAPNALAQLREIVEITLTRLREAWSGSEPGLSIEFRETRVLAQAMEANTQAALINLLDTLPHGVIERSEVFEGKVQTSTNLAHVRTNETEIEIATSSRSFVAQRLDDLQRQIAEQAASFGARVEVREGYPGWEPDVDSHLLKIAHRQYEQLFDKPPRVEVIHAGLECGVIVSKKPGMQAISFGPLIQGAHSPQEHVAISTVEPTWKLLVAILSALCRG